VPTDVTVRRHARLARQEGLNAFGRIGVWINGVGIGAIGAFDLTADGLKRQS
jgi:hypothetical protein